MIDIQVRLATENPNFTYEDNNRPLFSNELFPTEDLKELWVKKHFKDDFTSGNFTEISMLDARVNYKFKGKMTSEEAKTKTFITIKIDGKDKFYFITKAVIKNSEIITYTLKLDVITTYFDKLKFKGSTKVERRHYDRINFKNKTFNMDKESGVWNQDGLEFNSFIFEKALPINTDLKYPVDDYKKNFAVIRETGDYPSHINFYQYGIMSWTNNKTEGSDFTQGSIGQPTIVWPIATQPKSSAGSWVVDGITYYNGNAWQDFDTVAASELQAIVATPLPHFIVDNFYMKQGKTFNLGSSKIKAFPSNNTKGRVYDCKFPISQIIKDISITSLDTDSILYNEPKVQSSQFLKIIVKGYTEETTTITNEFILNTADGQMKTYSIVSPTQVNIVLELLMGLTYYNMRLTNDNMFILTSLNQIPSLSSPYKDFMNGSQNAYNTGINNNKITSGVGAASGFALGALGALTANPILAAGGAFTGIKSVSNFFRQDASYKSQLKDIKNKVSTSKGNTGSIFKDLGLTMNKNNNIYGDTGFLVEVHRLPKTQEEVVHDFYTRFGYISQKLHTFTSHKDFSLRYRFSYWAIDQFSNCVDKTQYGNEIIDEFNRIFSEGITFWNVLDNTGRTEINEFSKENWEWEIAKSLKKVVK